MQWADEFLEKARMKGVLCSVSRRVNGWPETMVLKGKTFFVKSVTYNADKGLYFQGVDPGKLSEQGDFVLLCGGIRKELKDIFIIPWDIFFSTLTQGEPRNTYKPPKEYFQYKFHVRNKSAEWLMRVQGGKRPEIDVTQWRFGFDKAIDQLRNI